MKIYSLIYYSKKKKLLFSNDETCLYIINFNVAVPETIQKINYIYENMKDFLKLIVFFLDVILI